MRKFELEFPALPFQGFKYFSKMTQIKSNGIKTPFFLFQSNIVPNNLKRSLEKITDDESVERICKNNFCFLLVVGFDPVK